MKTYGQKDTKGHYRGSYKNKRPNFRRDVRTLGLFQTREPITPTIRREIKDMLAIKD